MNSVEKLVFIQASDRERRAGRIEGDTFYTVRDEKVHSLRLLGGALGLSLDLLFKLIDRGIVRIKIRFTRLNGVVEHLEVSPEDWYLFGVVMKFPPFEQQVFLEFQRFKKV